ncbi:hypothetical protein V2J09_019645 [Rumex salicifolius]
MKWYAILGLVVQSSILIIVVFVLSIWLCCSLSDYCCCFRRQILRPWTAAGSSTSTGRGLSPTEIERFPKFTYPEAEEKAGGAKMSGEITECAVCLGAFNEAETLRLIPSCGHVFHADCVDVWLRSHSTCPCCRANLRLSLPETTNESPILHSSLLSGDDNKKYSISTKVTSENTLLVQRGKPDDFHLFKLYFDVLWIMQFLEYSKMALYNQKTKLST